MKGGSWSRRAAFGASAEPPARALRFDLTRSNPTGVGLPSLAPLVAELGHPRGATYEPSPLGELCAREAVAGYYASRGCSLGPERVVITASSSEAYAWVFTLLCDPGDEVLVPVPSYPLFELLARVSGVTLVPVPTLADERFALDPHALARAVTPRTRALVVVHPNNPTGALFGVHEARSLCELCAEQGLALVADEVFGDWVRPEARQGRLGSFAELAPLEEALPLVMVISGLSKVLLAPQLKLGWIGVVGPRALRSEALARLEWLGDTFLSTGGPVQRALPALLARRAEVQEPLRGRLATNLLAVDRACAEADHVGLRRLPADAGWYAVLEVPRTHDEDEWVEACAQAEVAVQPGYFFDFAEAGRLVVSLLPEPAELAEGMRLLARVVGG